MAKTLLIYSDKTLAGKLIQHSPHEYEFAYDATYCDGEHIPISPTLPITTEVYRSEYLFPFFANLLPEGANKRTIIIKPSPREHFQYRKQIPANEHLTMQIITCKG